MTWLRSIAWASRMMHVCPRAPVTVALTAPTAAILVLGMLGAAQAQLAVTDLNHGVTAANLANMLIGSGVTISNVVYTGDPRAAGRLTGGSTIIGFDSGIVLATGKVQTIAGDPQCSAGVEGPNDCTANSTSFGRPGDSSLTALSGFPTADAAILEFDFVPQFATVTFRYVFASEEYNEFANTSFNDVFAFFVNGVNCARIPGTTQPVSVNTINNGNPGGDTTPHHPELFRDNVRPTPTLNTQMDGLTVVLTCQANVNPGQTNHMKLAIADASDASFDTAVFIQAGSLISDTTAPDTVITGGPTGTITTNSASFTWTGSDSVTPVASLVYAFRLNPVETAFSAFGPATSKSYSGLGSGNYTFSVKAKDQAGNEDATPATRSFTVALPDTTAPDTVITAGPTGTITTNGASFTWTGSDNVTPAASLVYAFRLDPVETVFSAFGPATSKSYAGLGNGSYVFFVKARDQAGNEDATPATRSFTVAVPNTTAPDTVITAGPTGTITTSNATFSWTGSDDSTSTANLVYAFRLDPAEPAFSAFGSATSKTYTGLTNRSYTFLVKARDQAGNEDPSPASRSFTVNATAAMVTSVTGPVQLTIQGQPVALAGGTAIPQGATIQTGTGGTLSGTCTDGTQFTLSSGSTLFLDDALCQPSGSGMVDLTQGQFRLTAGTAAISLGGHAAVNTFAAGVRTPVSQAMALVPGSEFFTNYSQSGKIGTATTMVTSGAVQVKDSTTGALATVNAGQNKPTTGAVPEMVAAILPSSRSVQVGGTATAFGAMINTDQKKAAIACGVSPITSLPGATFSFQTTVPNANVNLMGAKNTQVAIPPGGVQNFVIALQPTAAIVPAVDVQFSFACGGTQAPISIGLDTLLFTASATPVPDIVAVAGTLTNDGIVNIPGAAGTGVFVVATTNLGASATITVSADSGGVPLPIAMTICPTDAAGGCQVPPAVNVTRSIGTGAQPTFAIFVAGNGTVPFDPGNKRIFVRFKDAGGVTRGSTSVAPRTQ